jgi:uncharacterized protein
MDIVVSADGPAADVAHEAAWRRFMPLLDELVAELPRLRQPVAGSCPVQSAVARRMWWACQPFAAGFITPMAAVAGAVAQELIACYQRPGISRAWVNNGGDIALNLTPGTSWRIGVVGDLANAQVDANFAIAAEQPVRGVATSGWRGRSLSLGIADSVTVLARTAAMADAAATVIANAVDVQHPRILRRPASQVKDNSDLGERLVTVDVPPLSQMLVRQALQTGMARARLLQQHGLIASAMLHCQGQFLTTNTPMTCELTA